MSGRYGCNGSCDQGRKPCNCELDADRGKFVPPWQRIVENVLLAACLAVAIVGVINLLMERTT